MSEIKFVTSNIHKFSEAKDVLSYFGIDIIQETFEKLELQSDNIIEIAESSMDEAQKVLSGPLLVEDAGMFISTLNDFPGTFSKYVYMTIGCEGVLKLLEDKNDRKAEFRSALVYYDGISLKKTFLGKTLGAISYDIRGENGFAFDKIFIANGLQLTFAELGEKEKNEISHRSKAFEMFAKWIKSNGDI